MVELMQGVNGLQANGNGPWLIKPECPAPTHNTIRAGRGLGSGQGSSNVRRPMCICPQALVVTRAWTEVRRVKEQSRMRTVHGMNDPRTRIQPLTPEPIRARITPDFTGGLCSRPAGMKAADAGMNDQATLKGIADRGRAKHLCSFCPLEQMCREWVTTQESPAGSWGGVWGGLDPWNRKGLELIIRNGKAEVIPYVHA